jgi:hypothetical protein
MVKQVFQHKYAPFYTGFFSVLVCSFLFVLALSNEQYAHFSYVAVLLVFLPVLPIFFQNNTEQGLSVPN